MSLANRLVALASLFVAGSILTAQAQAPTVAEARVAVFASPTPGDAVTVPRLPVAECGSTLKNAALLGLGFFFAAAVLELTYTFLREPFVLNGVDLPAADPRIIMAAGGAGFVVGLVGTEMCRRRRR